MAVDDLQAVSMTSAGDQLRTHWRAQAERWASVSAHTAVAGTGRLGAAVGQGRRVVRYLLRWYINPIVEQQNQFNAALLSLEALHRAREVELVREVAELSARVATLEHQLSATATPAETTPTT